MDLLYSSFLVELFVLISLVTTNVRAKCYENGECGCTSSNQDGGYFPENPLSWEEFDDLIVEGQTLEYLEVYSLKPSGIPTLSNTIYQWKKTTDGLYSTSTAGLDSSSSCRNQVTTYAKDEKMRYHVRLNSVSNFQETYVTTLVSTCPSRYLILWMCPLNQMIGDYCNGRMEISIAAPHGPENLPWQLLSKDMCRNKMPYLDDDRWYFTYTGPQCELPPPFDFTHNQPIGFL